MIPFQNKKKTTIKITAAIIKHLTVKNPFFGIVSIF